MPIATVRDSECHYEIVGEGPPLLLVTGLAGVASYWDENVEGLARDFTVIRYDHRGTGRSSHSEQTYSVEELTEDLVALLNALDLQSVFYIGHSTGAAIGQVLAAKYPDRVERMVLYGSWATLCPQMRLCMEMRLDLLEANGVQGYHGASPVFLYPPRYVCEQWPKLKKGISSSVKNSTSTSILRERAKAVINFDGTPYLPEIQTPTLVLVAMDDILTPVSCSEEVAAGIEGATLQVLPYGAHATSICEPDGFNRAVTAFLQNISAREELLGLQTAT